MNPQIFVLESWLLPKSLGGRIKGLIEKSLGLVLGMARVTVEDCICLLYTSDAADES